MSIHFTIEDWAAYAPGLYDQLSWKAWAQDSFLPVGVDVPALSEMPSMQRRRLERVGRMALQVAYWCQSVELADIPLVFASRHGDIQRTYEMLEVLARKEALSPTNFGLSIHNAIVAQYSIARQLKQNYLAVAAGKSTAEAAIIEALGLLSDGAEEVLVVMYDGLLPEAYQEFLDETTAEYAWAWRLSKTDMQADRHQGSLSLELVKPDENGRANQSDLPHGLDVMRFLLSGEQSLHFNDGARHWRWQRHV
ncbi:MAG: beta-ketoacyl synthase chain length factor [Arenimonas sp.]